MNDKERTEGLGKALRDIREAEKRSAGMVEEAYRQAAAILKTAEEERAEKLAAAVERAKKESFLIKGRMSAEAEKEKEEILRSAEEGIRQLKEKSDGRFQEAFRLLREKTGS
ncbi:MAG: hypothetical protein WC329_04685 [Candidatus Omnitrophota bacterium]